MIIAFNNMDARVALEKIQWCDEDERTRDMTCREWELREEGIVTGSIVNFLKRVLPYGRGKEIWGCS